MSLPSVTGPILDIDLFADGVLLDPYPAYRELRDAGPAVYLSAHSVWAMGRYADVKAALHDVETYSSAAGVAMLEEMSAATAGPVLGSDPPQHDTLRAVLTEKLAPRALRRLRTEITERADRLVAAVVERGGFDGVTDLCARLPVDIVADLVADLIGLPLEGRDTLLPGADAIFCTFGPMDQRLQERLPHIEAYQRFINSSLTRESLTPDGWGAAILDAVDDGRIAAGDAGPLMTAYMVAGMDTTVNSLSNFLQVLATRPEIWDALQQDPGRISTGYEEILRLESPVQAFFRVTTRDVEIDGARIPAGARVMLFYGSANRDERQYPDPDRFDHLAFGYGTHGCAGQGLARIEAPPSSGRSCDGFCPSSPLANRTDTSIRSSAASIPFRSR